MTTTMKRKKRGATQADVAAAVPARRKKKKKPRRFRPDKQAALEAAGDKLASINPADRIRHISRGYKLGFGSLPSQKKLTDRQQRLVNRDTVRQVEKVLSQSQRLLDNHPARTAVASAKNAVMGLFCARTLPYPDPGIRILILKTEHLDFDKMTSDEIDQDFARQMEAFSVEIRAKLADYAVAVQSLQRQWQDVLDKTRETFQNSNLADLYDPENYPEADELPSILYHVFRPYNIEPPREYLHMSPQERERVLKTIEAQFEQAVQMQAEFVVKLLNSAISDMIDSVSGYHSSDKRSFKNSVVERVFKAFAEFKEKTVKYGILRGDALEHEFKRAIDFMTEGLTDEHTLPGLLRQSPAKRVDLIEKMSLVKDSLGRLAERQQRRSILRD